jgi:copper chaperone NosL
MKKLSIACSLLVCSLLVGHALVSESLAAPEKEVKSDSRCAVCGMFVAKYPNWLTQIRHADGTLLFFDGAKDMLAYYFSPEQYGTHTRDSIKEMWVRDYYTLQWLDGRKAYYVTGSDVTGPMGHEFVPFSSREAAAAFRKDHQGEKIWTLEEITPSKVNAMRSGHMMKMNGHHPGGSPEEGHQMNGGQMMHHQ